MPMVQMDFCFMDSDKGERVADILNLTDCKSDAIGATMLPGKEITDYPVTFGAQTIDGWGRARCVLRTDQEVTIRKLAAEIKAKRAHETVLELVPRHGHQ